jgi:micrococcal nuclease
MNRYLCCFNCFSLQGSKKIEINLDELTNLRVSEIKKFIPPINNGKVIKIYDGDTITIISKLPYPNSPLYKFSVRLLGIDCPEIKGKDESERECAQLAKNELTELVMDKIITLENVQTEKYGRLLADVYLNSIHINDYLLKKRLAVKYDGTSKKCPKNWMDYYIKGEF